MCKESKKKRLHLYLAKEADPPSKFQEKKERKKNPGRYEGHQSSGAIKIPVTPFLIDLEHCSYECISKIFCRYCLKCNIHFHCPESLQRQRCP